MGRWRPPQQRGSCYITPEGMQALKDEWHQLWYVERPQVTAVVHEAAKNGDRSENGDYIYGKRRLREIDRRLRYLNKRMDELTVVNTIPSNREKIYFGAKVTLEQEDGQNIQYRIVGPDEFDLQQNKISMDAPLAKAMIGKRQDDEITINTPEGKKIFYIVEILYE